MKKGRSVRGVLPVYWIFDSTYRNAHTTYGTQRCQRFLAACNKEFFPHSNSGINLWPASKVYYDVTLPFPFFLSLLGHRATTTNINFQGVKMLDL